MLPASMAFIEKAGMMEAVMAAGFQYKDGAAFLHNGQYHEFNFAQKFTPGYGFTYEVQRADFDKILIDEAERQGAEVRYEEIGRASCRERVCQYVWISVVAVSLKKTQTRRRD